MEIHWPRQGGPIGEYTTSGTPINASLITGLDGPSGLVISGTLLFVSCTTSGTIDEYTTYGATVNDSLVSGLSDDPNGLAISGSDLFVANYQSGTVGEYTTSGATVNASLISGLDTPRGISIVGSGASDLLVASSGGGNTVVVGAEPVSLDTKNGAADTITGVDSPSEDLIVIDMGVDSLS